MVVIPNSAILTAKASDGSPQEAAIPPNYANEVSTQDAAVLNFTERTESTEADGTDVEQDGGVLLEDELFDENEPVEE
jgi:hypothetical protein